MIDFHNNSINKIGNKKRHLVSGAFALHSLMILSAIASPNHFVGFFAAVAAG
jgi:hypothetical protein